MHVLEFIDDLNLGTERKDHRCGRFFFRGRVKCHILLKSQTLTHGSFTAFLACKDAKYLI